MKERQKTGVGGGITCVDFVWRFRRSMLSNILRQESMYNDFVWQFCRTSNFVGIPTVAISEEYISSDAANTNRHTLFHTLVFQTSVFRRERERKRSFIDNQEVTEEREGAQTSVFPDICLP
jgi:hypothetical protein